MRKIRKGLRRAQLCVSIRRALLCAIQQTLSPHPAKIDFVNRKIPPALATCRNGQAKLHEVAA